MKTENKTKRIRARRMWLCDNGELFANEKCAEAVFPFKIWPVAVIDAGDGEALVRRIEGVIDMLPPCCSNRDVAEAVAKDFNLIGKRGGGMSVRKRKKWRREMSDELDTKTDGELSGVFAVGVAGWRDDTELPNVFWRTKRKGGEGLTLERKKGFDKFATDANAVMPWLGKFGDAAASFCPEDKGRWYVGITGFGGEFCECAFASTFARAACVALIRAARARKGGVGAACGLMENEKCKMNNEGTQDTGLRTQGGEGGAGA